MKKICLYAMLWLAATLQMVAQPKFDKAEVKAWMKRVADWQIANPNKEAEHDDLDWTHAALYMGMVDWAELTENEDGDSSYYKWLLRIGRRNHFQMGKWMYHADFIAVGQPFIDLYRKYGEIKMIAPVMARANWVVDNLPEVTLELDYSRLETLSRWSWCDALFMAPPVYAKLYAQTIDKKYLNFLNREYKATYDYLYDKEEQMFYRDRRYFDKREANGKKVFWGRGNGWVLGGLAEILPRPVCHTGHSRCRLAESRRILACQFARSGILSFARNECHRFYCLCFGLWYQRGIARQRRIFACRCERMEGFGRCSRCRR